MARVLRLLHNTAQCPGKDSWRTHSVTINFHAISGQRFGTFSNQTSSFHKFSRRTFVTTSELQNTIDPEEVKNFDDYARKMWSEQGEYELLHLMNRIRVEYIVDGLTDSTSRHGAQPLEGKSVLDVGCGGGLLSEPLARLGAQVTGIDASETSIQVAKLHSRIDPNLGSRLQYLCEDVTNLQGTRFDAVVASEVIEHVSDVDLFLDGCCRLVRTGGSIFLTTMNRTRLAYLLTIALAENVLGIVPRGMHDWDKYVTPAELTKKLSRRGFPTASTRGMLYNPFSKRWSWQEDLSVNYALHAVKMAMEFPEQDEEKS